MQINFFPKIQVFVKQGNGGTYWPVTTVCVCFYDDLCSSANRSIFFFFKFLLSQQISSPACSVKLSVSLNKKKEQKIDEKMINKRQNICFLIKKFYFIFIIQKVPPRGLANHNYKKLRHKSHVTTKPPLIFRTAVTCYRSTNRRAVQLQTF